MDPAVMVTCTSVLQTFPRDQRVRIALFCCCAALLAGCCAPVQSAWDLHEACVAGMQDVYEPTLKRIIPYMFCIGIVGIFMLVIMRKRFIIDYRLHFPSGTATGILISGFHTPKGEAQARAQVGFSKTGNLIGLPPGTVSLLMPMPRHQHHWHPPQQCYIPKRARCSYGFPEQFLSAGCEPQDADAGDHQ